MPSKDIVRECSTETLKMIYYVVIGLAITEGLQQAFIEKSSFLGWRAFFSPSFLMLLALVLTVCRFVHGASIHLSTSSEKRYKLLLDFAGFFVQASLFYLMALSLVTTLEFSVFFIVMLVVDTAWILLLRILNYIKLDKTMRQWLRSNVYLITLLLEIALLRNTMPHITLAVLILTVSALATAWDYHSNRDFYFPAV